MLPLVEPEGGHPLVDEGLRGRGGRRAGVLPGQPGQRDQAAIVAQPLAEPLEEQAGMSCPSGEPLHQA